MAFPKKDWRNYPDTSTPITAEALEDLETRLSDYTDSQAGALDAATEKLADKGQPSGYASLDASGRVPFAQLPGQEIAYGEYGVGNVVVPTDTFHAIAGLQVAVPAGSPAHVLEAYLKYQIVANVANSDGILYSRLLDEAGVVLDTFMNRHSITTSGKVWSGEAILKRRLNAPAVDKTYHLEHWFQVTSGAQTATLLAGPGNTTSAFGSGPVYLQAMTR